MARLAGRLHGNTDVLSQQPCEEVECHYCRRVEEQSMAAPIAVLQAHKTAGNGEDSAIPSPREHRHQGTAVQREHGRFICTIGLHFNMAIPSALLKTLSIPTFRHSALKFMYCSIKCSIKQRPFSFFTPKINNL